MAKISLTTTYLDGLKFSKTRVDIFDAMTPGLHIRVTADRKSWSYLFTLPGEGTRARLGLGTYPATSLKEARQRATEALGKVEAGIDPRAVAAAPERPKTVRQLCADRLELEINGRLRTAGEIERRYNKYVIPLVGDVAVKDFKIDPHYNKCLDPLVKQNKLRQAGVVHTDLITLMEFAKRRGVIEYSRIDAAQSPDPKNVRTRFLTTAEIPAFWDALPKALVRSKTCQRVLRLCLATGQRLSEVAGMTRGELNLAELMWTIPAERVKNGKKFGDHTVPLSALALSIIREAQAVNSNASQWLFPNDAMDGPLAAEVIASTLRRAFAAGDFAMPAFTPHDLRRTVGTQMLNKTNQLAITKHQKYLVLNHQSALNSNVSDEVYDQNDYTDDKREALAKWGDFLGRLVGADQMRAAA